MLERDVAGVSGRQRRWAAAIATPARSRVAVVVSLACALCLCATPARADMALSKVVVDFTSARPARDDIEITNPADEILYVSIEPAEIVDPGGPQERRVTDPNPRELGLLVSPTRLVLGPGERKVVRLSLLERPKDRDRIYRVAVKPVMGEIVAKQSALKVVVGYDVLVIARPENARPLLEVSRSGNAVEFRNVGNTNALLFNGRQCAAEQADCAELPSKRIYAGNTWEFQLPATGEGRFMIESDGGITVETF
jgi:Mat/Ecp fimbriae periplasmic chaperone